MTKCRGFGAPFAELPDEAHNGQRRLPHPTPLGDGVVGNGPAQIRHYRTMLARTKPTPFVRGCDDGIFTVGWGREWAGRTLAAFDTVDGTVHFLQNTRSPAIVKITTG